MLSSQQIWRSSKKMRTLLPCTFAKSKTSKPRENPRCQSVKTTTDAVSLCFRLHRVLDRNLSLNFLVRTGSEVSVSFDQHKNALFIQLLAANESKIPNYTQNFSHLKLVFVKSFLFPSFVDLQKPIPRRDFLSNFNLSNDLKNRCLRDSVTSVQVHSPNSSSENVHLHFLQPPF